MAWTASDWFQLWTALAVTAGSIFAYLTYRLGRWSAQVKAPTVSARIDHVRTVGPTLLLTVDKPDNKIWTFSKVKIIAPKQARIATPERGRNRFNEMETCGSASPFQRQVRFHPAEAAPRLVLQVESPSLLRIDSVLALRTQPRVTSRCTTYINIAD